MNVLSLMVVLSLMTSTYIQEQWKKFAEAVTLMEQVMLMSVRGDCVGRQRDKLWGADCARHTGHNLWGGTRWGGIPDLAHVSGVLGHVMSVP